MITQKGRGDETNDVFLLKRGNNMENAKIGLKYKPFTSLFLFKTENARHKWKIFFLLFKKQRCANTPKTNDTILNAYKEKICSFTFSFKMKNEMNYKQVPKFDVNTKHLDFCTMPTITEP